MIVVAVKDVVSNEFGSLACYKNIDVAKRSFKSAMESSPFRLDMQLFKIGDFDPDSGLFKPELEFIMNGDIDGEKV